jgi:hypothetical protein
MYDGVQTLPPDPDKTRIKCVSFLQKQSGLRYVGNARADGGWQRQGSADR